MISRYLIFLLLPLFCILNAADPADLAKKFKQLPTVAEKDLPIMDNRKGDFRGKIEMPGLTGHTWVSFPFVENPGSFGFDRKGRLYVAEANRFWLGVPDLRGANEMIRDDFQAVTVEDRLRMYDKFKANFPEGWFEKVADRIIRLEDRDKNGAADHRTLFSDHFRHAADGIGFSVLADEDGTVYFTCIPSLWKLKDSNDDGVADSHEKIVDGFGVRVSFIGHDLHGITRGPDGLLYFSVGDRGYHLKDGQGKTLEGSGRGAIFRCRADGSALELFCSGLRNPQELVFDDFGNLFTFDNTGDIGDKARMVYALNGTDSGWDMAHQSAHHYVGALDWGDFHPEKSMWVAERMFDTHNEEQPQWVYPPASHVAEGPSGVTFVTGESLPENLRNRFLLSNYRGASTSSTTLAIGYERNGAGYRASDVKTLVAGVAASDVELGYDGKIYLCDFGGGWSVNTNGSVQVIESTDETMRRAGEAVAKLFADGFDNCSDDALVKFLGHPDRRVRFAAQFALVNRKQGLQLLLKAAEKGGDLFTRLHAVWGLGQMLGKSTDIAGALIQMINDPDEEIRANVVRVLGDNRVTSASAAILESFQNDASIRVRSLAAVALGRVSAPGDAPAVNALYSAAVKNGPNRVQSPTQQGTIEGKSDIVLRHALLSGLDLIGTVPMAVGKIDSKSEEERLLAVLFLRRRESPELVRFLNDSSPLIRREVVRAIYYTAAMDSEAGQALAAVNPEGFPQTIQRRLMAANYRSGKPENARALVKMAGNPRLDLKVRKSALQGLLRWEATVETDPVHGTYRPVKSGGRTLAALGKIISTDFKEFLGEAQPPELLVLAMKLADAGGIQLDGDTLFSQALEEKLEPGIRIAALDSLVERGDDQAAKAVEKLLEDGNPEIQAAALRLAYQLDRWDLGERAYQAILFGPIPVARAAIEGMAKKSPERWAVIWEYSHETMRSELKLDAYLATLKHKPEVAQQFAKASADNVFKLSEHGGDPIRGEQIYLNQGACRQCHKIGSEGGLQGPDLTAVAARLTRLQILTSIYNPGAEISPGYGTAAATLKDGSVVMGRIAGESSDSVTIIAPDGKSSVIKRSEITNLTPPISAMPPLGALLPPQDLRDLVAYIANQTGKPGRKPGDAAHGDGDEAIAK